MPPYQNTKWGFGVYIIIWAYFMSKIIIWSILLPKLLHLGMITVTIILFHTFVSGCAANISFSAEQYITEHV